MQNGNEEENGKTVFLYVIPEGISSAESEDDSLAFSRQDMHNRRKGRKAKREEIFVSEEAKTKLI